MGGGSGGSGSGGRGGGGETNAATNKTASSVVETQDMYGRTVYRVVNKQGYMVEELGSKADLAKKYPGLTTNAPNPIATHFKDYHINDRGETVVSMKSAKYGNVVTKTFTKAPTAKEAERVSKQMTKELNARNKETKKRWAAMQSTGL